MIFWANLQTITRITKFSRKKMNKKTAWAAEPELGVGAERLRGATDCVAVGGGAVDLPQQAAEVVGYSEGEVGAWIFLAGRVVDWGKFANFVVDFCAL